MICLADKLHNVSEGNSFPVNWKRI